MENRQKQLLNLVINNYIETAEPVGSRFLLSGGKLDCGEATVRNELRILEEEGYLTHPHTSAGRIPTQKGYRFYVDNIEKDKIKINKKDNDILGMSVKKETEYLRSRKDLAKQFAELTNLAVLLAFSPDSVYYTGLSNLFSQPEFKELDLVTDVSQVFDHCENCLEDFYDQVSDLEILVGDEHPFGGMLSIIASRFNNQNTANGLVVLLGPMRMDYQRNLGLARRVSDLV
jgi:heat-inducible transcriptional repressor